MAKPSLLTVLIQTRLWPGLVMVAHHGWHWPVLGGAHQCEWKGSCSNPSPQPAVLPFSFLDESHSCQAGAQWCNLGSLPPLAPRFKQFSFSASLVAGTTGACHHIQLIFCIFFPLFLILTDSAINFCIFSREGVSPCWPGWSRSLDLR